MTELQAQLEEYVSFFNRNRTSFESNFFVF